ncbi:MAG: hypothetical protein KAI43_13880 [Candidatus Aureabacteria bacterium]|nr:hypothetical protein [Candidatus Auribacterota bacterium]
MTKYLKSLDFIVIGTLVIFGVSLIAFGILYDSYLYKMFRENRTILNLYSKDMIQSINKEKPREIFAALIITEKYNNIMVQKKLTFYLVFLIGLILCLLAMFYLISTVLNSIINEMLRLESKLEDYKTKSQKLA